jgi:hypothetical protein
LLAFVLGVLIIFFAWNIYYLDEEMQNSAEAMVTYFTTFLQFGFYALTTTNHLSFNKYGALQVASASRLFFYAWNTKEAIYGEELLKDFYIAYMATEIAAYAFIL